jgi:hypothetical protein
VIPFDFSTNKISRQGATFQRLVLLNLRYAQIAAVLKVDRVTGTARDKPQACLTNFNLAKPSDDPKNSYTMGLTIVVAVDGSVSMACRRSSSGCRIGLDCAQVAEGFPSLRLTAGRLIELRMMRTADFSSALTFGALRGLGRRFGEAVFIRHST